MVESPSTPLELEILQRHLADLSPPLFELPDRQLRAAGVFVCFERDGGGPGAAGDMGWAGAALVEGDCLLESATITGTAGAAYQPGLLGLREGPLLAAAVRQLREPFDVLLVNATGRDHPRRAGLALQLGAHLDVPTIGVTHRPLLAEGSWPTEQQRGARTTLVIEEEVVGYWIRTRSDCRPLAIHAAWRTRPDRATELILGFATHARTPEPLRQARRLAREARATGAV